MMPGVEYMFRIRALNSCGCGGWSPPLKASTRAGLPTVPSPPTLQESTSCSLTVGWTAPNCQGSPITGYTVQMTLEGGGDDGVMATHSENGGALSERASRSTETTTSGEQYFFDFNFLISPFFWHSGEWWGFGCWTVCGHGWHERPRSLRTLLLSAVCGSLRCIRLDVDCSHGCPPQGLWLRQWDQRQQMVGLAHVQAAGVPLHWSSQTCTAAPTCPVEYPTCSPTLSMHSG